MRVMVICAAGIVSGKEIMCLLLMDQLKQKGHEPVCVMSNWGSDEFRRRLRALDTPFFELRIGFISKTLSWPAMRMTLVQALYLPKLYLTYWSLIRREKPDRVIHTNFHHTFLLYPFLGWTNNIYWSHEVIPGKKFYRWLFRLFQRRVHKFLAVSEIAGKSLNVHLNHQHCYIINNGLPLPPDSSVQRDRNKVPALGIIGQVAQHKGHELLMRALSEIAHIPWSLHIFGKGLPVYEQYLHELAGNYRIADRMVWHGFVGDVDSIYQNLDVVVVPSNFQDPFPTTIIEAGLRGVPVIGSTSGGIPEMITAGVNGWIFKTGQAMELSALLAQILVSVSYKDIRQSSRDYAADRFSLKRFIVNFESVLTTTDS